MRSDRAARLPLVAAMIACAAMVLAGCGGSTSSESSPTPSATPLPTVAVPSGVTLTAPGTTLGLGSAASVAYQPNQTRSSVLRIRVVKIARARVSDLSQYVLDARTKASTPYYVHLRIDNVGTGDVGGTDIPLWAVSQADTLIHTSGFTNTFKPCPSPGLPKSFGHGARLSTCVLYLIPDHGTLRAISFRPMQSVAGIEWRGPIEAPATKAPKHKHKHKSSKHAEKAGKKKP